MAKRASGIVGRMSAAARRSLWAGARRCRATAPKNTSPARKLTSPSRFGEKPRTLSTGSTEKIPETKWASASSPMATHKTTTSGVAGGRFADGPASMRRTTQAAANTAARSRKQAILKGWNAAIPCGL